MRLFLFSGLLLHLIACSEMAIELDNGLQTKEGTGTVRIDIRPSNDSAPDADEQTAPHLPTTLLADLTESHTVDISLQTPVLVSGRVSGWEVAPWLSPSLPGSEQPIQAHLSLTKEFSAQSYFFSTDEDGYFETWAIPDEGYALSITPTSENSVFLSTELDIEPGQPFEQDFTIDYGNTLWGQVTNGGGQGVTSVGIFAEDYAGNRSATTYTNDSGYYSMRLLPGEYTIHSIGRSEQSGRDPILVAEATLEPGSDLRSDFVYPSLQNHAVGGKIVNKSGDALSGVVIQFVSTQLEAYPEEAFKAHLNVSVLTNSFGNFDTRLPAGSYQVFVLPTEAQPVSSLQIDNLSVSAETYLGQIELGDLITVSGEVTDDLGVVPGARIQCEEGGASQRYWSTISSENPSDLGEFSIDLPRAEVVCHISPPGGRPQLAFKRVTFDATLDEDLNISLETGTEVRGVITNEDGAPVAFSLVQVYSRSNQLLGTAVSNNDGEYTVSIDIDDTY